MKRPGRTECDKLVKEDLIEIGGETEEADVTMRVTKWREDRPAEETQWRIAESNCAGSKRGSTGRTQLERLR